MVCEPEAPDADAEAEVEAEAEADAEGGVGKGLSVVIFGLCFARGEKGKGDLGKKGGLWMSGYLGRVSEGRGGSRILGVI